MQMCVNINEAGDDGFATKVDYFGSGRRMHGGRGPDGGDAIIFDENVAAIDNFLALHGHQARAAEIELALRNAARNLESDGESFGLPRVGLFRGSLGGFGARLIA